MNKVLLIINVLLLAAVGYLYYLHYNYTNADEKKHANEKAAVLNSFKIAYFELDSVQNNYQYYKEVRDDLTKKDQANTQKLNKIKSDYLNKYQEYQKKGPQLSEKEQNDYQQMLMKLQNDYQEANENVSNEMNAEATEKLQSVKKKIEDYLKGYCSMKGLAYVFAASDRDNFLYYKDTIRNITPDIIAGLNEDYKKTKSK
jgi:outer membrane protein